MADDPANPNPPTPAPPAPAPAPGNPPAPAPAPPEPKPDDVEAMKAALKKANNEAAAARAALKTIEDATKSEGEKLIERATSAEARAAEAEARLMKLEVGEAAGLTPRQSLRLVGATKEELEADATEMAADFAAGSNGNGASKPPAPAGKPRENLKPSGSDPDAPQEETDIKKLGESMFTH